ncbi:MAG: hypothetical protein IPI69_11380 [Bacteroidales bacterium]|nr:hypothetical protein [Bacteroidales bacterium]
MQEKHRAQRGRSSGHRAQGAEEGSSGTQARGTEEKAQSTGHGAQGRRTVRGNEETARLQDRTTARP